MRSAIFLGLLERSGQLECHRRRQIPHRQPRRRLQDQPLDHLAKQRQRASLEDLGKLLDDLFEHHDFTAP